MCFYRNYKPEYESSEEYTKKILKKIKTSMNNIYLDVNKYPYNCKWLRQNINTEHLTLFFSKDCDKELLRVIINDRMDHWYSLRSVPDEEKSVKIPHVHLIKEIQ